MTKRSLQELQCNFFLKREASARTMSSFRLARLGNFDAVPRQKVAHKILMLLRDALGERVRGYIFFVLNGKIFGNEHINPVRLAIDVIVDPLQLKLKLIRRKRSRTKDAKAACPTDGCHHITTVAERHQREVDTEYHTKGCF